MAELPTTRDSLILRLRDPGDAAAWHEFVTLYEPLILRLAARKGLQDADAQDLCQVVFTTVAKAIERWDPDPALGSFRGWLSRIARNLLVNFLTRNTHEPRGSGATSVQELLDAHPSGDPSATALFEAEYRRRVFRWAADQVRGEFKAPTWEAFWKTAVEGQRPGEVAKELNLSIGAVYIARSRILARLRQQIEEVGDEMAIEEHSTPEPQARNRDER
jgi:RNA polymerase sigma-70 factor (ECF subfamily)